MKQQPETGHSGAAVSETDERTLWAGEDDYDTGHVKGWNANRIEQAALLKKQGFIIEEDAYEARY